MVLMRAGSIKSARTESQLKGNGRQTDADDGATRENGPVLPPFSRHEAPVGLDLQIVDHQSNDVIEIH